jgi:hypothetical protein
MGFFKSIKTWLNQNYGGRYVSAVLRELFLSDPKIASRLFEKSISFKTAELEVSLRRYWPHLKRERRADLALFDEQGRIVGLVEVKYEDQKNDRNHAQLSDYIKFSKSYHANPGVPVIVLTKSPLPASETSLIERNSKIVSCISYGDIVRRLQDQDFKSAVPSMVIEYFKEEAFMFNPIDADALELLMINALNIRYGHGRGRKYTHSNVINAPRALESLITNTEIIGDRIHSFMDGQRARPITRFRFFPKIAPSKVELAKKDLTEYRGIQAARISAGALNVYYPYHLYDGDTWRGNFEFGFYIDMDVDRKEALKTSVYASVWFGNDDDPEYSKKVNLQKLTEDNALKIAVDVSRKTLRDTFDQSRDRDVRKRLVRIKRAFDAVI